MTTVITVTNAKGGVLKTTTAATLAHKLALLDADVLLVDADPQGNLATTLGLPPGPAFAHAIQGNPSTPIAARGPSLTLLPGNHTTKAVANDMAIQLHHGTVTRTELAATLRHLATPADRPTVAYMVIDTPPGGILQEVALLAADVIVIPVALDYLAMEALAVTLETIRTLDIVGAQTIILPTMYGHTNEAEYNLGLLHQTYPGRVTLPVPYCPAARSAAAEGKTVWEYHDRHSRTLPAMRAAYEQLAHWIATPVAELLFGA